MSRRVAHPTDILRRTPSVPSLAFVALLLGVVPVVGCGDPEASGLPSTLPRLDDAEFTDPTIIDHSLSPLLPGFHRVYFGQTTAGPTTIVARALDETREVERVESRVVLDEVFLAGRLVTSTHGWYAQDDDGNVWAMGEAVERYEVDDEGVVTNTLTDGSWEAGQDVAGLGFEAHAGWRMPADPQPGDVFHQQLYEGVAEDVVEVLARDVAVTLADGSTYSTLQTQRTRLDAEAEAHEHHAAGIGNVLTEVLATEERHELVGTFRPGLISVPSFATASFDASTTIDNSYFPLVPGTLRRYEGQTDGGLEVVEVEVLAETRVVSGIECAVVRNTVTVGGQLMEDTRAWFAQDDDGNVWTMGEAVDVYAYDAQGTMLEVTHEGSWEAGIDIAGLGVTAAPGHQMPADPLASTSYHQEWYEGADDTMAYVVATEATVELPDGTVYQDCLQTLEWAPHEPAALEHRYYAPGVGLVMAVPLDAEDEAVALAG